MTNYQFAEQFWPAFLLILSRVAPLLLGPFFIYRTARSYVWYRKRSERTGETLTMRMKTTHSNSRAQLTALGLALPCGLLLTFLCAAVLNLFVPSGGGHWAIQAPVMFTAGADLGVDPGLTGIAIAWGDAWTNLIQPFWALPALAIAKLNAKDIMGFCLIDLLINGLIICGGLLVWAL